MKTTTDKINNAVNLFKLKHIENLLGTFFKDYLMIKKTSKLEIILMNRLIEKRLELSLERIIFHKKTDLPYIHHFSILRLIFYRMLPIDNVKDLLNNYDFNQTKFNSLFKKYFKQKSNHHILYNITYQEYYDYLTSIEKII